MYQWIDYEGKLILNEMHGKNEIHTLPQVIQRVTIPVHDDETGIEVTIAFDDTPGYVDTTYDHQIDNVSLMQEYKRVFFPEPESGIHPRTVCHPTFPNVILLVAAWDSITPDAHNEPGHFTSSLGKSMFNLITHGLVDPTRSNVIVVITKSMSSWDQFDDIESEEKKKALWNNECGQRRSIILEIQRKIFPKSTEWPVVFIENGGSKKMDAPYRTLPNCELSHQNLFNAICDVIAPRNSDNAFDLAGIQALRLLSGGEPLYLTSNLTREVLLSMPQKTVTPHTPQDKPNAVIIYSLILHHMILF